MGRPRTIPRVKFNCAYCADEVEIRKTEFEKRKRLNCKKKECISKSKSRPGSLNPMYGLNHSTKVKSDQAKRAKVQFSGKTYEEMYGEEKAKELKNLRSKTFKKTWENPERTLSFLGKKHSEETKSVIGKKSSEKFTDDLKERYYQNGIWTRPEEKSDWEIYKQLSNWIAPMWGIVKGAHLVEKYGVWHPETNNSGLVRDHIVSRKYGFDNNVFPEILRHPCNCEIILHKNNSRKGPNSGFTLNHLFNIIKLYNKDWKEQNVVLEMIYLYESGSKWARN